MNSLLANYNIEIENLGNPRENAVENAFFYHLIFSTFPTTMYPVLLLFFLRYFVLRTQREKAH